MHGFAFRVYSLLVLRGQTHQGRNFTILSTPFYEACQARHFLKRVKHTLLWSTAQQIRRSLEHAKHTSTKSTRARQTRNASTQAHHLAVSFQKKVEDALFFSVFHILWNSVKHTILRTIFIAQCYRIFFQEREARHFIKHAKHVSTTNS